MNSPITTAAALSTSASFAAVRRDRRIRLQATGRAGSRAGRFGRHRFRGADLSL